jgi:methyl-accepting chemotaxis protein
MLKMDLKNKLLLLALLPLTLLLLSLMASAYYIESKNLAEDFTSFEKKLLEGKKNLLETEVEIATKIVNYQLSLGEKVM